MLKLLKKIFVNKENDEVKKLETRISILESEIALLKSQKCNKLLMSRREEI